MLGPQQGQQVGPHRLLDQRDGVRQLGEQGLGLGRQDASAAARAPRPLGGRTSGHAGACRRGRAPPRSLARSARRTDRPPTRPSRAPAARGRRRSSGRRSPATARPRGPRPRGSSSPGPTARRTTTWLRADGSACARWPSPLRAQLVADIDHAGLVLVGGVAARLGRRSAALLRATRRMQQRVHDHRQRGEDEPLAGVVQMGALVRARAAEPATGRSPIWAGSWLVRSTDNGYSGLVDLLLEPTDVDARQRSSAFPRPRPSVRR